MLEHPSDVVTDTNGVRYEVDRLLGEGGQGAVYSVRGANLAVKLVGADSPEARRLVDENVARLKRLPLGDLNVARPLRALAKPHAGYVMELMTGMQPLRLLTQVPRGSTADVLPWYLRTGGLRRRLRLLAHAAEVVRAMHGRGLSYGDASPDNVFVSEDLAAHEVWLIDCDNVVQGVSPRVVYTPGYAAPEVFRSHKGADSLTDAWSLATIVFETLCALHPFDGDLVQKGEPELEEQAFRGLLPWVDDAADDRNRAGRGLPRDLTLTRGLRNLAEQTFGAGRLDRMQRPGASAWATHLHQAADQTLACPSCTGTYYLNHSACPWCDEPAPAFVLVNVYARSTDEPKSNGSGGAAAPVEPVRPVLVDRTAVQVGTTVELAPRLLAGTDDGDAELHLGFEGSTLTIRSAGRRAWDLEHRGRGERRRIGTTAERLDLRSGSSHWQIAAADAEGARRVVGFELRAGGRK